MKPRNDRTHLTSRHRLRDFDYTLPGYYFLTFATHKFQRLFGVIEGGVMQEFPAGEMMHTVLSSVEPAFTTITVDSYVVMPNHIHMLLYQNLANEGSSPSDVVRWIKGNSLAQFRQGVKEHGWKSFDGKLWNDGFHDEILRTETQLENVRRYIVENPQRWDEDEFRSMKDEGGLRRT